MKKKPYLFTLGLLFWLIFSAVDFFILHIGYYYIPFISVNTATKTLYSTSTLAMPALINFLVLWILVGIFQIFRIFKINASLLYASIVSIFVWLIVLYLFVDMQVIKQFNFPLTELYLRLLFTKGGLQFFEIPTWDVILLIAVVLVLIIGTVFAMQWLAKLFSRKKWLKITLWTISSLYFVGVICAFLLSMSLTLIGRNKDFLPVYTILRYTPFFIPAEKGPIGAAILSYFPVIDTWFTLPKNQTLNTFHTIQGIHQDHFIYPKHPLQIQGFHHRYNVVFLMVDSLRSDRFTPSNMPHMYKFFHTQGMIFEKHYASGDQTYEGLFGLFYGSPAIIVPYVKNKQPPVFSHLLSKYGYRTYFNATIGSSPFADTSLQGLHITQENLEKTPFLGDKKGVKHLIQFIQKNKSHLFFAGILTDGAHTFRYPPGALPYQPVINQSTFDLLSDTKNHTSTQVKGSFMNRLFNNYRNAVLYEDKLLITVIRYLKKNGLLKNTIIVLTSDHGQEFNESGSGRYGHGGSFNKYQSQIPLGIYIPGIKPKHFQHKTSAYDVSTTLIHQLFNIKNPNSDFSVGKSLFSLHSWKRLLTIASSNQPSERYAILKDKYILQIYPYYQYLRKYTYDGKKAPNAQFTVNDRLFVIHQFNWFFGQ